MYLKCRDIDATEKSNKDNLSPMDLSQTADVWCLAQVKPNSGVIAQRNCDEDDYMVPLAEVAEGDEIRIANGPMANFWGQIEKLWPDKRAWALPDIQETRVPAPCGDLGLASS